MATSVEIRNDLVEALRLDLVGPDNNHAFANELLFVPPTRWYFTGFITPTDAPIEQRTDDSADEEIDSGDSGGTDDDTPVDRAAARKGLLPSSLGISFLVRKEVESLDVTVTWGDYIWESGTKSAEPEESNFNDQQDGQVTSSKDEKVRNGYRRIPRTENIEILFSNSGSRLHVIPVPNSDGLYLSVTIRDVEISSTRLPEGSKSISVFLVNRRQPANKNKYKTFAFQAALKIESKLPFVPRPDLRGEVLTEIGNEWDERLADLHYRNDYEYAVGHGVSVSIVKDSDSECFAIKTCWIPTADVNRVAPASIVNVELGMEALGSATDYEAIRSALMPLITQYRDWINAQELKISNLNERQANTANELIAFARVAADRIEAGINSLHENIAFDAFRIANKAMANAARHREAQAQQKHYNEVDAPRWRPFQLAYILMNLRGMVDPTNDDRKVVDLLFFPTGGGKTEAYLGLAAFTLVQRRLKYPGMQSAGVTVIMRYTLRLLTLDQLGRASALMCALELEREQNNRLGTWPFEIGLWVGTAATPNRLGHQGYDGPGADDTAYRKWIQFRNNSTRHPSPIPIENCPWCGEKFTPDSFRLVPNQKHPLNLVVHCTNINCEFSGDRALPIIGVDEVIYRRLPAFIIATVDKFASLPWIGNTGGLFGLVQRYDQNGFYGPMDESVGTALSGNLPAPELIIQDELHLISGPLGTIAGIYEIVIDALSSRIIGDTEVRPKIIASTATVRRADTQIQALFGRTDVTIFPPQGIERTDSFFAKTEPATVTPARMYIAVAAQGRSPKAILLRSTIALLSAGQTAYVNEGGHHNHDNSADPYMTLIGYFNSLRELGGSRRIMEDEVRVALSQRSSRRRIEPTDNLFSDRNINFDILELTSRVSTNEIASNKRRLSLPFYSNERVDVALATNMISVGLDITRLGLMIVFGQPKSKAEYIQATSRVGRNPNRPGLVLTLLNLHKPRDRSHYERFENFHNTFYRAIEPTSVTPFSPRALDRALVASIVALVRLTRTEMTPPQGAELIIRLRNQLDVVIQRFGDRAENSDRFLTNQQRTELRTRVINRCRQILDTWFTIAQQLISTNTRFQYQHWEANVSQHLLFDWFDSGLEALPEIRKVFRANRSMRDVERSVDISTRNLNDLPERR